MRKPVTATFLLCIVFNFTVGALQVNAQQLKLGNRPTQIEKSAVLELESNNQGLLLTRVPDTSVMTSLGPPDGMIIYFTDGQTSEPYGTNAGVYQRKDGAWQRITQFFLTDEVATGPDDIAFTRSHDTITLHVPDATPTVRGVVNGGEQSFGGDKLFRDSLIAQNGFRATDAQIDNSLTLSNSPNPTNPTEWFLSTDGGGKVFLQKVDDVFWKTTGNSLSGTTNTLGTNSNTDLSIITNGTDRMHITKEGKVGIGTNNPSDTLTVNGSFKLGRGGSSFSAMAHTIYTGNIPSAKGYTNMTWTISGIKENAHVIVNPRKSLVDGSNNVVIISWVRASATNTIIINFYSPAANSIGSVTFDVYYINPK